MRFGALFEIVLCSMRTLISAAIITNVGSVLEQLQDEHTCDIVQHHGIVFQVYCVCLLLPRELTALFVPTYTNLSSVFDRVGWVFE